MGPTSAATNTTFCPSPGSPYSEGLAWRHGFGELWHLLDRLVRVPVTLLEMGQLDSDDLDLQSTR